MKMIATALLSLAVFAAHAEPASCKALAGARNALAYDTKVIAEYLPGNSFREESERGLADDKEKIAFFEPMCAADTDRENQVRAENERLAKLPEPQLGMTAKAVLEKSSWGKPDHVNRTVTVGRTTEQWVYEGTGYLYFTNGKLTGMQN